MKITFKCSIFILFIFSSTFALPCRGLAELTIYTKTGIDFKLQGYDGLEKVSVYNGTLPAEESCNVETPYNGLAMLIFQGGQKYPLIIGSQSTVVTITNPDVIPSFAAGDENKLFYKLLANEDPADNGYGFAGLMIQGKELLDSSSSIKTVSELHVKKVEFQRFMKSNYRDLSRSDLLRRLIGQYFMMHEYVNYHRKGSPAGDIPSRYRQEVLSGVKTLLVLLQDHIPENELLNYCIGLYYNRGMVTMASIIADNFTTIAYCGSGDDALKISDLPATLDLINPDGSSAGKTGAVKGEKIVSVVSTDCPVSMVRTVIKARELAEAKDQGNKRHLIVIPLEKLSEKHRAMNRNVSGGAMLFVDDVSWVEKNVTKMKKGTATLLPE